MVRLSHRVPRSDPNLPRRPLKKRAAVLDLSQLSAADQKAMGLKPKQAKRPRQPQVLERKTEREPDRPREPGPWKLVIEWDVQLTNPNRRLAWRLWTIIHKRARRAGRFAWEDSGWPESDARVILDVVVHRAHRLDQANIWSALKQVLDGVFVDGLTRDDNEKWLVLGSVKQEIAPEWKGKEQVVFLVRREVPLDAEGGCE